MGAKLKIAFLSVFLSCENAFVLDLCQFCLFRMYCRHGLYRSDQLIYNDLELSFKETVPQTALFDPNSNQGLHLVLPHSHTDTE